MKPNTKWVRRCLRNRFVVVTLGAMTLSCGFVPHASAQLLVNASNSAMGATSSAPDAAHFQNAGTITDRAAYIGYSAATGTGYMDNTGSLTANGTNSGSNVYGISENWGVGVGVFDGGQGYFINSGAGTVTSTHEIRVGDGFGGTSHGEFYHQSSGAVTAGDYLTVGNSGGTGKFVQSGTGAVDVGYELWVGVYGGAVGDYSITNPAANLHVAHTLWMGDSGGVGTFTQADGTVVLDRYLFDGSFGGTGTYTQQSGSVEIGFAGNDYMVTVPELYLGHAGGNGTYNLQGGTMTVYGWTNIGRDNGMGVFNNSGTFKTVQDLRIGANYDVNSPGGNGTVHNLTGGMLEADVIRIADVFFGGLSSQGLLTVAAGSSVTTTGPIFVGNGTGGTGTITQNGGMVASGLWITMGEATGSTGTYNLVDGSVSTGNSAPENLVLGFAGTGNFNQTKGDVSVVGALVVGWTPTAVGNYKMDDGTITVTGPIQLGIDPGSEGTFTMNKGTITCNDWVVTGTFGGTGHFFQHGGTINTVNFDVAQSEGSNGDYHMDSANSASQITASGFFAVGDFGTGTFDLTSGTTSSNDWTYVGYAGTGTFNIGNGTHTAGDNFSIGTEEGAVGNVNLTTSANAVVNVTGNAPTYTGNLVVGDHGSGTLTISTGTINLNASITTQNSLNSATTSLANHSGDPPNYLADAQDGNLSIAEEEGTGVVTLSGTGVINVAANVFVGGFNTHSDQANFLKGGNGTLTISGGELHVGTFSGTGSTGGDLVLGSPDAITLAGFKSHAAVTLSGGLLDVAHGTGAIVSAGAADTTFTFSGGTLKVKVWNPSTPIGGNLGPLTQSGPTSLLDVTGNDTTINNGYALGAGTATIGTGRTLTAQGVTNTAGAGVINVGTGPASPAGDYNSNGVVDAADYALWRKSPGAYGGSPGGYNTWRENFGAGGAGGAGVLNVGTGAVDVDTLNLNNGTVTAGAGVSVATVLSGRGTISNNLSLGATAITKLSINSASSFDKIIVGGALNFAGSLQVTLGFTPAVNQTFDVFDFVGHTGTFTSVGPNTWDTSQLYSDGILKYLAPGSGAGIDSAGNIPEPANGFLVAMAIATWIGNRSTCRQWARSAARA
jgi:hypothetical protein